MHESDAFKAPSECHQAIPEAYRSRHRQKARDLVAECRRLNGNLSGLDNLYDGRLDTYEANPPAHDWDGVFVAATKSRTLGSGISIPSRSMYCFSLQW